MKKTTSLAAYGAIVASALLSIFTLLLFKFGPLVEKVAAPVFIDIKSTFIGPNYAEGTMDFLVVGVKDRSCLLVTPKIEVRVNNEWLVAGAIMLKQDGTRLSVEEQRIPAGAPFIRRIRVDAIGDAIRVGTESRCHPLWLTETHLFYRELQNGALP